MKGQWRVAAVGVACFVMGVVAVGVAQRNAKPSFSADLIQGKDPKAAAAALLDVALQVAKEGSWERIAVGRAWYLGGDKEKGQQIFDAVTSSKKVEGSDLFRVAHVYLEADEWDKASAAFERAVMLDPGDDTGAMEYAELAMARGDRTKAEAQFAAVLTKKPDHFWNWVNAGGLYLGVKPE